MNVYEVKVEIDYPLKAFTSPITRWMPPPRSGSFPRTKTLHIGAEDFDDAVREARLVTGPKREWGPLWVVTIVIEVNLRFPLDRWYARSHRLHYRDQNGLVQWLDMPEGSVIEVEHGIDSRTVRIMRAD
jgi:hypothetical protein